MDSSNRRESLLVWARGLVYASVILGIALLAQLYTLVPDWLFASVFTGWFLYLIVAVMVSRGYRLAYPAALVLGIVTLAVSLPQPEHYVLIGQGFTPAALTFIIGSALQVGVILVVASYLLLERKRASLTSRSRVQTSVRHS